MAERKDFNEALADLLEEYKDRPSAEILAILGIAFAVMDASMKLQQMHRVINDLDKQTHPEHDVVQ